MTRKELVEFCERCDHVKRGYVCFQNDGLSRHDLKLIGSNSGVYGWNWSAYYYPKTDTVYISYYRGVPAIIKER